MKEEPNTKFYFDYKIARVVFERDVERKIYWFDITDLHPNLRHLPIEEWLREQGMTCVEDDMMLFELAWV